MYSKKLKLTQWPVFHSPKSYEASIQSMCDYLKSMNGVKSIYQVGGISDYGISDIDLLVIFDDNIDLQKNPLIDATKPVNRYLFTHRLFGTTENRIHELENFTRFGKYKLLFGKAFTFSLTVPEADLKILEKQIALEYMIKAFISLHVAVAYRQVKVRNLLLHVKALKLDLELLQVTKGEFFELVNEFISMRKVWFEALPDARLLEKKILQFHEAFGTLLNELLQQHPFYLPGSNAVRISRNIELIKDTVFRPPTPSIPMILKNLIPVKRREVVLNRLYKFCFRVPMFTDAVPEIIQNRYDYISRGTEFNNTHLPFFLCTAYGLDIFNRKL